MRLNKAIDSLRFAKANIAGVVLTGVRGGRPSWVPIALTKLRLRIREGMSALTDSHCHFLPGVDDGAAAEEESWGFSACCGAGGGRCNGYAPLCQSPGHGTCFSGTPRGGDGTAEGRGAEARRLFATHRPFGGSAPGKGLAEVEGLDAPAL